MAQCSNDQSSAQFPSPSVVEGPSAEPLRRFFRPPPANEEHFLFSETDTDATGFYIVCGQEATNLIKNPTFFANTNEWSTFNSKKYRTNDRAFDSGFSLKITGSGDAVTAERRAYVETEVEGWIDGDVYTLSAYLWTPEIWAVEQADPIAMTISIVDVVGGGEEEVYSEQLTDVMEWKRLTVSKQIREGATNVYVRINLRSDDVRFNSPPYDPTGDFNLEGEYIYADMIQFEYGPEETTPFHGSSWSCSGPDPCGDFRWLGIPHESPSYRSECAGGGGRLCSLSELGFEIISMSGLDAPTVQNISTPYANRPGEFCEATSIGSRIITFNGYICSRTCELQEIIKRIAPNSCGDCCGEFLLVYKNDHCSGHCESERSLAICVSYIGGLDGTIDSRFNRRLTLQFKAHDPFFFEWPGHSSAAVPLGTGILSNHLAQINPDGSLLPFALNGGLDINTVECAGNGSAVIGGSFDEPQAGITDSPNLAVIDCGEICPGYNLFSGVEVLDLARDAAGNVIIGSAFGVSIYYPDLGTYGSFPGYAGGAANAVAAPSWAEVVVGSDTGVYIQLRDGSWITAATNGPVYDITIDNSGNIIAVGDFTTIDGIEANRSARFNVNVENCLDATNAQWEAYPSGAGFDGPLYAAANDPSSGVTYVGGLVSTSTPFAQETCIVTNGQSVDSKGGDQIIRFEQLGADHILELGLANVVAQRFAEGCLTTADPDRYIRITATSSLGTQYSLLVGEFNLNSVAIYSQPATPDAENRVVINLDLTQSLGEPCESLNPTFVEETESTKTEIAYYAGGTWLPGGPGEDNTISSFTIQCVNLQTTFQGDSTQVNNVAAVTSAGVTPLGDGLPVQVNKLFVHPLTGDVYAILDSTTSEYPSALALWDGNAWTTPDISASGSIVDMAWCPNDCGWLIAYTGRSLITPSAVEVLYCGTADVYDPTLILQGPGTLQHFDINDRIMRACTSLECSEVGIFDFGQSQFSTQYGRDLSRSILAGSRKDFTICARNGASCPNKFSLLVDPDTQEGQSSGTVLWRNQHWSYDAECCTCLTGVISGPGTPEAVNDCCDFSNLIQIRDPSEDDNCEQGYEVGDAWLNIGSSCPRFYINTGQCVDDCEEISIGITDSEGGVLQFDNDPDTDDPICWETSP